MPERRADEARAERGARRVLEVLAMPRDRPRQGLMQHQFYRAFSSDGWTLDDFRTASHHAYQAGWIDLDANFYCLTKRGEQVLRTSRSE